MGIEYCPGEPDSHTWPDAQQEAPGEEEPCRPNGFGLCMTHPTCEHVRESLKEFQDKSGRWQNHHDEVLDLIEAKIEGLLSQVRRLRQ